MVRKRHDRTGATVVEVAVILPVFVTFIFSVVEVGHAIMVSNMVKSATRTAARYGSTEGVTSAQVRDRVRDYLRSTMNTDAVTIVIKDASVFDSAEDLPITDEEFNSLPDLELSDATPRSLFIVRATVNFSDVAYLNLPYMDSIVFVGQSFMRHE